MAVIVVEDGLSSNGPHIEGLAEHRVHFILGPSQGDHAASVAHGGRRRDGPDAGADAWRTPVMCSIISVGLPWGAPERQPSPPVGNFLEYWEVTPDGQVQHFSWVTDLD